MNKIEFFSSISGVADLYPIKASSDIIPKWLNAVKDDFLREKHRRQQHLYKCPGIMDILTTGYIITTWHDILVETDGTRMKLIIPSVELKNALGKEPTEEHPPDGIASYFPKRPWSIDSLFKLNTPWHVVAPKNIKFLMTSLPYHDCSGFECVPGILDPKLSTELNIQGYWNITTPGSYFIEAGTPIAHLIPLSEKTFDFEVRDANDKDKKWLEKRKYFLYFSFIFNRTKAKSVYSKFFFNK